MSSVQIVEALPEPGIRGRRPSNDRGAHWEAARELRRNRGKWGRITDFTSSASSIARGHLVDFRPAGAFEAVTRTENGKPVVYARFVGGTKAKAQQA